MQQMQFKSCKPTPHHLFHQVYSTEVKFRYSGTHGTLQKQIMKFYRLSGSICTDLSSYM